MDGADQPAGSFPNHCGLIRCSRESLEFQPDNEVAVPRVTLSLCRQCTGLRDERQLQAVLGNKTVTSKKKRLQDFLDKKAKSCSAITALLLK